MSHRVLPLGCQYVMSCVVLFGRETSEFLKRHSRVYVFGDECVKSITLLFGICCVPSVRLMLGVETVQLLGTMTGSRTRELYGVDKDAS